MMEKETAAQQWEGGWAPKEWMVRSHFTVREVSCRAANPDGALQGEYGEQRKATVPCLALHQGLTQAAMAKPLQNSLAVTISSADRLQPVSMRLASQPEFRGASEGPEPCRTICGAQSEDGASKRS